MGIQGTGGFYVRSGIELKPLKYGGEPEETAHSLPTRTKIMSMR